MQSVADRPDKVPIGDGRGRGRVERALDLRIGRGGDDQPDQIVTVDPARHLPAMADRPAQAHLEHRQQPREHPAAGTEHDAGAEQDEPRARPAARVASASQAAQTSAAKPRPRATVSSITPSSSTP